jgi:nitric oxide reductase subunit C
MAGPTLAGLATRAEKVLASDDYTGEAADVEAYIRESITSPSAHVVPGAMFSASGVSFMPNTYATTLSEQQIDDLAAYLGSFK